jgi:hypothetical protein
MMRRTELLLLCLIIKELEEDGNTTFKTQLLPCFWRLRQGKIRQGALADPDTSAFSQLFSSKQDDALVTLCGFDHKSFEKLHSNFEPLFNNYSPYLNHRRLIARHNQNKGQRRLLNSTQCLALVLAWTRTRGSLAVLQIIFGITAGQLSLWLQFGQ